MAWSSATGIAAAAAFIAAIAASSATEGSSCLVGSRT